MSSLAEIEKELKALRDKETELLEKKRIELQKEEEEKNKNRDARWNEVQEAKKKYESLLEKFYKDYKTHNGGYPFSSFWSML